MLMEGRGKLEKKSGKSQGILSQKFGRHPVSRNSKSVTPEMTNAWNETSLPTILPRFKFRDIYNADVFGLFYQGLPTKLCI